MKYASDIRSSLFECLRAANLTRLNEGVRMAGLLEGKKGLVLNIANDRSIAWAIADNAIKQGATCGFGFLPMEKMERRVRKSLEEMARPTLGCNPATSAPTNRSQRSSRQRATNSARSTLWCTRWRLP